MLEWKEIALATGGFVSGLIFNLLVKILPTYIDLSKENQDLRERIRELESELEDERDKREKEHDEKVLDTRNLKVAMDSLKRRRKDDKKEDEEIKSQ